MRLHIPTAIRWSDLDAYGHVNNAAMFGLLEEARIHAFWAADADDSKDYMATRILEGGPNADTFTLIAHQEIEYLAPIPYMREPLDLQMWLGHVGGASLDVCYEIYSPATEADQTLYARATTTIVLVDSKTGKPRRMSDEERLAVEPYIAESITFRRRG